MSGSRFPLYDNLNKNIADEELKMTQKKTFLKRVDMMDKNGNELLYTLIRVHQLENQEENTSFTLPYNGTYVDNNICFDLDKLPRKLKQILFKFMEAHINKMNEDNNIEKHTPVKRI